MSDEAGDKPVQYPPLVEVEWVDVTGDVPWLDVDDLGDYAEHHGALCRNVGYLVHEDDTCIVLAGRAALSAHPQQVGHTERLPLSIILSRRELRPAGAHPMEP